MGVGIIAKGVTSDRRPPLTLGCLQHTRGVKTKDKAESEGYPVTMAGAGRNK